MTPKCFQEHLDRVFGRIAPLEGFDAGGGRILNADTDRTDSARDMYTEIWNRFNEIQKRFWCRYKCDELKYEDIADAEKCCVGTVYNRIAECRRIAGELMGDGDGDGDGDVDGDVDGDGDGDGDGEDGE